MYIEITKQIDASSERAFRALTDADELARWFVSSAESDPRTGGDFALMFEFEDESQNHAYAGQYEEVTPGERVRYPWNGAFGETTVEFSVRPGSDGTEVTLVHSGWTEEAAASRERHEQGWRFLLDNLERYLTGGEDERPAAMGMKTSPTAGASTGAGP
jgi:uncharacterized protein YndB with AHSA1/START domain